MLNYATFYRKFGVRALQQLRTPVFHDATFLELPLEAIYHYLDYEGVTLGPLADEFLFRQVRRVIPVDSIQHLTEQLGAPRRAGANMPQLLNDYFHKHRRLKMVRHVDSMWRDKQAPAVFNYAPLAKCYHYPQSALAPYYKWHNTFATVVETISRVTQLTHRQHFLYADAPKVLPSYHQLANAALKLDSASVKPFRDRDAYVFLELWKWLMHDTGLFSQLPKNKLHLVNLVFSDAGRFSVLNLGFLWSFRKPGEDEADAEDQPVLISRQRMNGQQMVKRLMCYYMAVMQLRTITTKNVPEQMDEAKADEGTVVQAPSEAASTVAEDDDEDDDDVAVTPPPRVEIAQTVRDLSASIPTDIDEQQLLEDLTEEEFQSLINAEDKVIDETLKQLELIASKAHLEAQKPKPVLDEVLLKPTPTEPEYVICKLTDQLASDGAISPGEHKRFQRLAQSYKTIQAPDGQSTLEDYVKITPEMLKLTTPVPLADSPSVLDKTMLHSSIEQFDERYSKHILGRDLANMALSLQKVGVAVTSYRVDTKADILGSHQEHVLKITPIIGAPSTLRYKTPDLNEKGEFTTNRNTYRLRKQRVDDPIRKIAPDRVALTSYYGKSFVTRGRTLATDYGHWLGVQVTTKALDSTDEVLGGTQLGDVFDSDLKAPRNYSAIARVLSFVSVRGYQIHFDHAKVLEVVPPDIVKELEVKGQLILGWDGAKTWDRKFKKFLVIDRFGFVFVHDFQAETPEALGSLEQFFGIDVKDAPVEYTSVSIFNKTVPVGVVLGLEMGLHNLLELLQVHPRVVPAGERVKLASDEFSLVFSDETLVINKGHRLASLILAGFNEFWRSLKLFSVYSFDQRGVYLNLLEAMGLTPRYIREIDQMYAMFVDPISAELLVEAKEPSTFKGLLFRATQMLLNDQHPHPLDMTYSRIRGNERVAGALYTELVNAIRVHNGKPSRSTAQIEMNPYAVWTRITEDTSKMLTQQINPIKAIKEGEAVTFSGEGGRNKRVFTRDLRSFHHNDMGVISESTVDNSDVSVSTFLSANPQLVSLRGKAQKFDLKKHGVTSLLSSSALLAPGSDHDDPKRVNFIAIQAEHAIACQGYHQNTVRTGYDTIVAQRTSELFAVVAKQAGKVQSVEAEGIVVEYADGTIQGYKLGRQFGNAAGLTLAHHIVTPLTQGDRFQAGDPVCYHDGFFEPDFFNKKQIVLKNALNATTALLESSDTHEDSSAISKRLSGQLSTKITKVKTLQVKFSESVSELVQPGQEVTADTPLCFIEDAVTANNKLFDEASLKTLKTVSAQTPRAKVKGLVERVEIYYHGDKEEMSESLRALADQGDKDLKKRAQASHSPVFTGKVDSGFRIQNNPLAVDCMAIVVYITSTVPSGVGDKGVFANQMKTVHGRVIEEEVRAEDGTVVDAFFGMKSIEARIVESPIIIGSTNVLLRVLAKRAVDLYRGRIK